MWQNYQSRSICNCVCNKIKKSNKFFARKAWKETMEVEPIIKGNKEVGVKIIPGRTTIGLVVRGMQGVNYQVTLKEKHVDCLLPYGDLMGFGPTGDTSCGITLNNPLSLGLPFKGDVSNAKDLFESLEITYDKLLASCGGDIEKAKKSAAEARTIARKMISEKFAKTNGFKSGVLLIEAPKEKVDKFVINWYELYNNKKKPLFHIIGGNCAKRARDMFEASEIINKIYLPTNFIHTPNKLFNDLNQSLKGDPNYKLTTYFGYFGLRERKNELGNDIIILFE